MVRFWCGQCNDEHDSARDCPAWQALNHLPKGSPNRKKLTDHAKRQSRADYRAPKGKGYKNAVEDGCAVALLSLIGAAGLIIWGAAEVFAAALP